MLGLWTQSPGTTRLVLLGCFLQDSGQTNRIPRGPVPASCPSASHQTHESRTRAPILLMEHLQPPLPPTPPHAGPAPLTTQGLPRASPVPLRDDSGILQLPILHGARPGHDQNPPGHGHGMRARLTSSGALLSPSVLQHGRMHVPTCPLSGLSLLPPLSSTLLSCSSVPRLCWEGMSGLMGMALSCSPPAATCLPFCTS